MKTAAEISARLAEIEAELAEAQTEAQVDRLRATRDALLWVVGSPATAEGADS